MGFPRRQEIFAAILSSLCRRATLRVLAAVVCGGMGAAALIAQAPADGAIHGVVRGSGGAAQAGALVSMRGSDGTPPVEEMTRADGTFTIAAVPAGEYTLSVSNGSLGPALKVPVSVRVGETAEVSVSTAASGTVVEATAPMPEAATEPDENGDGLTSARGLEPAQNGEAVDGVSAHQSFGAVPVGTGGDPAPDPDGDADSAELAAGPANGMARGRHAGVAYVFSQAAVREFRVVGRSYSAQAGRGGDVATTLTRSGGDSLHGSGFFDLRSNVLAARDPLAIATSYANGVVMSGEVKPHDLRERFGGAAGGPVPRLREFFYFYSFDAQRRGFPAVSSPADPNFYDLTATQTTLLANRGVTAADWSAGLAYLSSLTGLTDRRADQTLNFGRLDWRARRGVAASVEYNRVRWNSPAGLMNAPVVARGRASIGNAAGSLDMVLGRFTQRFSGHTINEARAAYIGDTQYETPQAPLAQEPAISPGGLAPEVNIAPLGLMFGTPAALSQVAYPDERRVQLADTLTLVRGRHLVEVGGEVSFVHDAVATLANAAGTFSYDSGATGGKDGGLVDFLTDFTFGVNAAESGGCPSIFATTHLFCFRSFSQSFGLSSVAFSTQEWAGFAEDTWRPRAGLTVHVGARYEYQLLPVPVAPNLTLDALFGSSGATSVFPEDRNDFGPRASVAWEPFGAGRGVVRAGYGVFFGQVPGATIRSALADTGQASSTTRIRIRPSAGVSCPQMLASGFGYPCAFTAQPPGVVAATTSAMVFDRRFRLPMVEQGSLAIERRVGRATRVAVTYVVNLDRQLPGSRDLNIAPSTSIGSFQLQGGTGAPGVQDGETFRLPVYTARVTPSFGPVTDIVSDVNASYNGLTVAVESQALPKVELRAEYGWSKAIDFGQAQSSTPRTNGQFDPFTNGYDKALSSLNYPQALRVTAVWAPQVESGPRWVRRAANGWDVAPIVVARSGRPYSLDLSGGTFLSGGHESLNGSGGALYLPTVGRNTLRLPATVNADLRVGRSFRAGARVRVQGLVEAFNLLNRQNVTSVSQRAYLVGTPVSGVTPLVFQSAAEIAVEGLNTQAFGTPTATGTSLARERQVQLGLRVQF